MKTKQITEPAKITTVTFAQYIGRRIRQRRVELRLTQQDVADQCDISKTFLSEVESGKRGIGYYKLYYLARSLQRSADWFAKGWDE